ncbi:MAG: twin-arginine translocase TatA/TatE family subunit [Solirubrobacterales bacterium]|nr:twin-arginine translocase TatA/TatE family subunit [Solirubrobacterales bacterium]
MPNIGPLEIAIVLVIVLIIFGPKRLPEIGRSAGDGLRELKSSLSGSKDEEPEREIVRVEAEREEDSGAGAT